MARAWSRIRTEAFQVNDTDLKRKKEIVVVLKCEQVSWTRGFGFVKLEHHSGG